MEASRGDYLFIPGADDFILPGFFEKSLGLLAAHPEAGLSFTFDSHFDGTTGRVNPNPSDVSSEPCYLTPAQLAARPGVCIPGHTAIFKRKAFAEAGGYLPELRWTSDWFSNRVIAYRYGACFIPECLSLFRDTPASYSTRCWLDRNLKLEMLAHFLRHLISPAYRDVLPFFKQSRLMQSIGSDIAHAACLAALDRDPDVVELVATLTDEQHGDLVHEQDPAVRELCRRAILSKLMSQDGSLEEALAALYLKYCDLQVQVRELQNFVAAVRNSPPFAFRRRLAATVRNLRHRIDGLGPLSDVASRWTAIRPAVASLVIVLTHESAPHEPDAPVGLVSPQSTRRQLELDNPA